jgi:hypothetical protein
MIRYTLMVRYLAVIALALALAPGARAESLSDELYRRGQDLDAESHGRPPSRDVGPASYSDSAMIRNDFTGQSDLTTRVENIGAEPRAVTVTSGGIRYNAGQLEPGESARVHVIEHTGAQPVIIFDK